MSERVWYLAVAGQKDGPHGLDDLLKMYENGEINENSLVFSKGMNDWASIKSIPEIMSLVNPDAEWIPPIPANEYASAQVCHEIDFKIFGEEMQVVEIELDPRESVIAEAGAMMYMENSIHMETIFGDGSTRSEDGGFVGKLFSAGKRIITGESLFMTMFTNNAHGRQRVAFAAPYPGKVVPMDLKKYDNIIICQKDAFLCAAKGVSVGIEFNKRIGVGLFGGEGFIMQKLEGDGLAFVHAGGTIVKKELKPGELVRVDTGCIVALTRSVDYDIQFVKGIKSAIFGGEGLFFATLTGPGTVWLQSIPFSRLAGRIMQGATTTRKGEGSILGGIGNLLDGDPFS